MARGIALFLLLAGTAGCYQSHPRPYESAGCAPDPREGLDDRVLLLERAGTALLLNEETFDGDRRPVARIADAVPEGQLYLSGSPDGATAMVTLASERGDHEHVWIVDLGSGDVRDVASGLNGLAGTACGAARDRADGTHERGWYVHGMYRGDGRRAMFWCARSLFDEEEENEIRRLGSSVHEYDLDAESWRTLADDCGFGTYSSADACTVVVSIAACAPYRFTGFAAIVDDEPRSIPYEPSADVEVIWLGVGGGYFVTRREGTMETLERLAPDGTVLGELLTAEQVWLAGQSPDGARIALSVTLGGAHSVVWLDARSGRQLAVVPERFLVHASPDAAVVIAEQWAGALQFDALGVDGSSHRLPTGFYGSADWGHSTFDPSGAFVLPHRSPYALVTSRGEMVLDFAEERMERVTTTDASWVRWRDSEILALSFRVARP